MEKFRHGRPEYYFWARRTGAELDLFILQGQKHLGIETLLRRGFFFFKRFTNIFLNSQFISPRLPNKTLLAYLIAEDLTNFLVKG